MANTLNQDGSVTLDSEIAVVVNKTVVPSELRQKRQQLRAQIANTQLVLAKLREALAQVRAEIAACVAVGAPSDPSDD